MGMKLYSKLGSCLRIKTKVLKRLHVTRHSSLMAKFGLAGVYLVHIAPEI